MEYSVIVPAFDEAESISELHAELVGVLEPLGKDFEIIFVDDGSADGTDREVERIAESDDRVRLIRFVRNFGKSAAYTAGFEAACGRYILTLDADLQDDAAAIPQFLHLLEEGYDLVVGCKQGRLENEPLKTIPSKVFNGIIARVFGIRLHDINCGFRAMRANVAKGLELYGNLYRFIPILVHIQGYRVVEVDYLHRKRKYGRTKYGARRFWTGLLDLLTVRFVTTYAPQRPLHFFGTVGLMPAIPGFLLECYVLIDRLFFQGSFQEHVAAIIVGVMLIMIGFLCIVTGLVGEMISASQRHKHYTLK